MCDDWRPAKFAPTGRRIIFLLPDEEICGGYRDEEGRFWRSHGNQEEIFPECWASEPAAPESFTRLNYNPRSLYNG